MSVYEPIYESRPPRDRPLARAGILSVDYSDNGMNLTSRKSPSRNWTSTSSRTGWHVSRFKACLFHVKIIPPHKTCSHCRVWLFSDYSQRQVTVYSPSWYFRAPISSRASIEKSNNTRIRPFSAIRKQSWSCWWNGEPLTAKSATLLKKSIPCSTGYSFFKWFSF